MKYPKFLSNDSTIGITAPSSGVGMQLEDYEKSMKQLKERFKRIIETDNVRSEMDVSSSPEERADQLDELVNNDKVEAILCATGGDFLTDMLPYINYDNIGKHPKWIMGYSDPTNLLYTVTTILDIATIYGHNAGTFDSEELHTSQKIALDCLKGNILHQESYDYYETDREGRVNGNYNLTEPVKWTCNQEEAAFEGRILGGCIDCLKYLPGTPYDYTESFVENYKNDGIIWYFDVFSMSAEDFYLTLFQLKQSSWFQYTKGVLVGRILFPSNTTSMTYEEALLKIFIDVPIIMNADIGHIAPKMTLINGSYAHVSFANGKGTIDQFLK